MLRTNCLRAAMVLMAGVILAGCQSTSQLGDGALVQKRKYTKGFHLNVKTPFKGRQDGEALVSNTPAKTHEKPVSAKLAAEIPETPIDRDTRTASTQPLPTADEPATTKTKKALGITFPSEVTMRRPAANNGFQDQDYAGGNYTPLKTHGLAVAGFIVSLVSIFVATIILGPLAVILSAIALGAIAKHPDVYKGRGLAIAGLIIGVVATLLILVVFASGAAAA